MEVLLDSSFVISCIKRNIDFISELESKGFRVILPNEVFQELKDLRLKLKHDDRFIVDLALEMFSRRKVERTSLGKNGVDLGLIQIGRKGAFIASLDSHIKRSVPNRVVISSSLNNLIIERD
jgi:rRNA-processing protein FCF1